MNINSFLKPLHELFLRVAFFLCCAFLTFTEIKAQNFKGNVLYPKKTFSFKNSLTVKQFDSVYKSKAQIEKIVGLKDRERWFVYEINFQQDPKTIVVEIPETLADNIEGYFLDPNGQIDPFMKAGDEGKLSQRNLKIRTPAGIYQLKNHGKYTLYIKYWRNGSFPHIKLKLWDLNEFIPYYSNLEFAFGLIYGVFFLYFIFTLYLGIANKNKQFLLFSFWIISNISFFVITAGHYKFYLYPELLNFNNKIRLFLIFTSAYFLVEFTLEYLNFRRELKWMSQFNRFVIICLTAFFIFLLIIPNNAVEKSQNVAIIFIQSLFLIMVVLVLSIPFIHYRKTKKISFLYFVIFFNAFNGIIFLIFAITNSPIDYNKLLFYLLILPFLEITAIAVGITQNIRKNEKDQRNLLTHNLNLQLKANQIQTEAVETERKRISTELHDDILNRLSMLLMLNRAGKLNNLDLDQSLTTINNDIRSYAYRLYPPWIEDLDFFDMVQRELDALSNALEIKINYHFYDIHNQFSPLQKINVFRIMQEFVLNAKKHGQASEVNIDIYQRENSINIYLEDNGVGFDSNEISKGIGMKSVVSRVNVLGGTIDVTSKIGESVNWMISFPIYQNHL